MRLFDLLVGLLVFHFITFCLYIAVVLVCFDRRKQRQQIVSKHTNTQRERHKACAEVSGK